VNPDEFQHAWQTQTPQTQLRLDPDAVLKELQLKQQQFAIAIFCRDMVEVGVSLLMVPVWIFLGIRLALPWTWYLTIIGLIWIAGFLLIDRRLRRRQPPTPGEPLRQCIESSLEQVQHQYWLLRNVAWWYLLPLALPMLIFFGHVAWQSRAAGVWEATLVFVVVVVIEVIIFAGVYLLNQYAVRATLEPRRRELETQLKSLTEETPA